MPLILPNDVANEQLADGDKLQQNFATVEDYVNQEAITRDGSTGMTSALLLPGAPTQPNQAASKQYVDDTVKTANPIGTILMFGGNTTAPAGYLFCQGQAISRATYASLFAVIGISYGAGDGSTTFGVPAMQGRSPMGYYSGGPWANTFGALAGSANAVVASHNHAGVDHLHRVTGNTGGQSANHYHNDQGTGMYMFAGSGPNNQRQLDIYDGGAESWGVNHWATTNYAATDHSHYFDVWSGASDRALTTGTSGVSATNANIPPVVVMQFIIKAV